MKKRYIGINTWEYTFPLSQADKEKRIRKGLAGKGVITTIFINNGLGFIFQENRKVY